MTATAATTTTTTTTTAAICIAVTTSISITSSIVPTAQTAGASKTTCSSVAGLLVDEASRLCDSDLDGGSLEVSETYIPEAMNVNVLHMGVSKN